MTVRPRRWVLILADALLLIGAVAPVQAGNIDPQNQGNQYAWGENVGWINFKPSQGPGVTVSASALTGFAWAENIGWINLSPVDGGVMNDGSGHLSGYAWGENVGWINFAPQGAGVTILPNGHFTGFAWGENIGWVNFGIPFGVQTSFPPDRPAPLLNAWSLLLCVLALAFGGYYSVRRSTAPRPR